MAFTRIWSPASSTASVFVIMITAALDTPYTPRPPWGNMPATEATLTIEPPPRSRISGTQERMAWA
jgi:hypothetical protein